MLCVKVRLGADLETCTEPNDLSSPVTSPARGFDTLSHPEVREGKTGLGVDREVNSLKLTEVAGRVGGEVTKKRSGWQSRRMRAEMK